MMHGPFPRSHIKNFARERCVFFLPTQHTTLLPALCKKQRCFRTISAWRTVKVCVLLARPVILHELVVTHYVSHARTLS